MYLLLLCPFWKIRISDLWYNVYFLSICHSNQSLPSTSNHMLEVKFKNLLVCSVQRFYEDFIQVMKKNTHPKCFVEWTVLRNETWSVAIGRGKVNSIFVVCNSESDMQNKSTLHIRWVLLPILGYWVIHSFKWLFQQSRRTCR